MVYFALNLIIFFSFFFYAGTVDATTSKYTWTQTIEEIHVNIPIPEGTTSKQIDCTVKSNHLKVGLRGQPAIIEVSITGLCFYI